MTTQTREQLLRALEALGSRFPEVRFGQLVVNVCNGVLGSGVESVWDVEDKDLLTAARQFLAELAQKEAATSATAAQ